MPVKICLRMLKAQANACIGMWHSETWSHGGFYRPDWYDQVVAQAEANALRALDKCRPAPVAKMADAAYWLSLTGPAEPAGLVVSDQPGKWKLDRHGPVTDELLDALRRRAPAAVRDEVARIDAARGGAEG